MTAAHRPRLAATIWKFDPRRTTFALVGTARLADDKAAFAADALAREISAEQGVQARVQRGAPTDAPLCRLVISEPMRPVGHRIVALVHPAGTDTARLLPRIQTALVRAELAARRRGGDLL